MFYYSIGYHYWDEGGIISLLHEKEFSQKEFLNFVAKVTPDIAKEFQKESLDFGTSRVETEEMSEGMKKITVEYAKVVKFSDVYEKVVEELCSQFGFQELKYSAQISIWNEDLFEEGPDDCVELGKEDVSSLQRLRDACQK